MNLSAVVENENLTVLEGRHGASVDVQVQICMKVESYYKSVQGKRKKREEIERKREPILMEVT